MRKKGLKVKLLKKLRRIGRGKISIYSVTRTGGTVTGMSIGYNDKNYSNLFSFGDEPEQVYKKAERLYLKTHIKSIRKRYARYGNWDIPEANDG